MSLRQRPEVQEVLWRVLIPVLFPLVVCLVTIARPVIAAPETDDPTERRGQERREAWYKRGFDSLLVRREPDADASLGADPRLARERFLPFAGLVIREVHLLAREAFGTIEAAGGAELAVVSPDSLASRASPFERMLNSLATPTRDAVLENFLLLRRGDRVVPAVLADSERMLRQQAYVRDALIVVLPLPDHPGEVDLVVLVRDRWPWGVQGSVKSADAQQATLFHRNVGGLGLNLETELMHDRDRQPVDGWRTFASTTNLAGTFIDLAAERRWAWDRDRTAVVAERRLSYPDLRLLGGWTLAEQTQKDWPGLPDSERLRSRTHDVWLGWNIYLRPTARYEDRRLRLVPAVRLQQVDFREPPLAYASGPRVWRDFRRYLLQLHLVGLDYYTTSLVYDHGETEDLPAGLWAALVGGIETGADLPDRYYHGLRAIWPRFLANHRYLALEGSLGGFRQGGRLADGVLDLDVLTFSPLQRRSYGAWRHFLRLRYTLGIRPDDPRALRLDAAALRDCDDPRLSGGQRLVADLESVLFTRVAVSGFKLAAFGYAGCGQIAPAREPIFRQTLQSNTGVGLRLNNPNLVLPTIEMRLGVLAGRDGCNLAVTLRMGEVKFVHSRLPDVQPALLPYR